MNNDFYSEQHLYNDLGLTDNLKVPKQPMEEDVFSGKTYEMDDGLYVKGEFEVALEVPPLLYDNSPLMGSTASPGGLEPFQDELDVFRSSPNLTQELRDFANSILTQNDNFPLADENQFDFDYGIASHIEDEPLYAESPLTESEYESPSPLVGATALGPVLPVETVMKQRRKASRKAAEKANRFLEEHATMLPVNFEQLYPDPSVLGVPSPGSSTSSSCGFESYSEGTSKKPRQRRPRVSYDTLTDEERYKRIRDLNNEASRNYRERQKTHLVDLEQQIPELEERNRMLKSKQVGLEKLLAQMKLYHENFFKESMNNGEMNSNQF